VAVFEGQLVPVDAGPPGWRGAGLNLQGRSGAEHRTGQANLSREEPQSGGEIRGIVRFQGRFASSRSHGNRREHCVFRG
jgi:hypothetical protein